MSKLIVTGIRGADSASCRTSLSTLANRQKHLMLLFCHYVLYCTMGKIFLFSFSHCLTFFFSFILSLIFFLLFSLSFSFFHSLSHCSLNCFFLTLILPHIWRCLPRRIWGLRIAKNLIFFLSHQPIWSGKNHEDDRFPQNSFIFRFCFGLKVYSDFPEFSKILCSLVTKRTIVSFRKP